ncbi:tetratricopeptide repeat protein, partial [Actinomadura kijaniata]|uniref:tetratricopeptide repeat protein n=1 Tax=Actinomadura kijaniata TaxID=46161 RepID=UPI00083382F8
MTDQQRRLGTPSTSGAEAAPASAGEQLAVELRRLYEAAGAPEHAVLARQAAAQRPPVKLPGSTFNDWLNGKTVPSASAAFDFVVTFLLARPDVRTHPGYQQRPLPWWQTLRAQAQAERRAARSRPRRSPTLTESPHSASSTETSTSASISSTARSAITAAPVYLPSQAGEFFVGRQGELARLDAAFTTSFDAAAAREGPVAAVVHQRSGPGRRVGAVHGLGGIGKSTLAAHWAATRRGEGETVWWIVADSPTAVREGLAGLGTALLGAEAAGKPLKALAEHAIGWLTRHHDWLLVLDNVHRPVDIEPVLARLAGAAGGRVLITSRLSTGWHRITGQVIALDVLEPEQAVELLTRTVTAERPGADLEGADELCAELGYLPLAIEQAAGYLAVNACSPRAYLQRLATYPAALYSHPRPGHDDNLDQTVARVWRSTLDHLTTAIPLAGTVLRVLAWWAPGEIPRALLDGLGEHLAGEDAGMAVQEAVAQLAAYNMITLSDDGQRIGVHRLVQAIARTPAPPGADHTIDPHRRANDITAACHLATTLLNQNRPADPFDPAGWPAWRTLLPHIEALADHTRPDQDTSTLSRLLDRTAAFLQDQGALTRAITYLERALAANQRLQGDDHPSTLTSRHNLALAYREVGDTGRAINLLERALADSERVRGADHSFTLTSRHNLAFAYREVGQVQRAISLYTQTLADSERVLGADHPSTLTSRHNLAVAYRE